MYICLFEVNKNIFDKIMVVSKLFFFLKFKVLNVPSVARNYSSYDLVVGGSLNRSSLTHSLTHSLKMCICLFEVNKKYICQNYGCFKTFFFLKFKVFNVPSVARNYSIVPQQNVFQNLKYYGLSFVQDDKIIHMMY